MANRLMSMHYNTSLNARNVLENYHKNRPLADIENSYKVHLKDDPFHYKKLVKRPETNLTMITTKSENDDEFIKRAIKSAPVVRTINKNKRRKNRFESKSVMLHNSERDTQPKKKHKRRSKSAINFNNNEEKKGEKEFMLLPMDELGYTQRKKVINEKIHEYWKQDSAQLSQSLKPAEQQQQQQQQQQWVPINSDNDLNSPSNNLIKENGDDDLNKTSRNVYHVSSDVGTIIAHKMEHGIKLVICRNGELVTNTNRDSKISNQNTISDILNEMENNDPKPLSWNDQLIKSNSKFVDPSVKEEKIIDMPVHERKLYVKKLIDEEEFKPKLKSEFENKYQITQITKPKGSPFNVNTKIINKKNQLKNTTLAKVTSVEIIGVNNRKYNKKEIRLNLETPDMPSFGVQVQTPAPGQYKNNEENLTEREYNQIIENLTKQYTSHKKSQIIETKTSINENNYLAQQLKNHQQNKIKTETSFLQQQPSQLLPVLTTQQPNNITTINNNQQQQQQQAISKTNNQTKLNLQSIANDYTVSNELFNRKKQTNANVNKTFQLLQNSRLPSKDQIKSRPNSPDLIINLNRKHSQIEDSKTSSSSQKPYSTNPLSIMSRTTTQSSIIRTNPISNALKTAKSKINRDVETVFINITQSIEPSSRRNSFSRHISDLNRNLHNPSFTTLPDNPVPSRLY